MEFERCVTVCAVCVMFMHCLKVHNLILIQMVDLRGIEIVIHSKSRYLAVTNIDLELWALIPIPQPQFHDTERSLIIVL